MSAVVVAESTPDQDVQNKEQNDEAEEKTSAAEESMEEVHGKPLTRNEKIRQKKKRNRQRRRERKQHEREHGKEKQPEEAEEEKDEALDSVSIEYVSEPPDQSDPMYIYFMKIFEAFKIAPAEEQIKDEKSQADVEKWNREYMAPKAAIVERIVQEEEEAKQEKLKEDAEKPKLSKKKMRILMRPSIGELKATTNRPDVVEWHDVTAKDPKLLVHLKSVRNTVPVPRHWCFKRKYLAGKRGFEKPPFDLPEFIKKTGIMEMRQALQEKEDQKSLKSKMREKIRPKLGKIDIDYQKLHDAFFRWQVKPKMSIVGDMYYEGKEFETKLREKKPGELSDELRIALGMPVGPNAHRFPPPWLIAMQRYGPPPSYPNLKIPGLNAPIPEGCAFGYHAGGWGKPPVDETGRPLYGDVFGLDLPSQPSLQEDEEIEHKPWGELESEESSSEEEAESEDEEKEEDITGLVTPAEGLITPSGISSGITTGLETPDNIELRKTKMQEEGGDTPALYTLLPEKKTEKLGLQMMASTHVYDISAAQPGVSGKKEGKPAEGGAGGGGVEVSLNPDELDLADASGLQQKYEEGLRQQQIGKEQDFSDMVAEHAARQKRKRKLQEEKKGSTSSSSRKYKDFKF